MFKFHFIYADFSNECVGFTKLNLTPHTKIELFFLPIMENELVSLEKQPIKKGSISKNSPVILKILFLIFLHKLCASIATTPLP